MRRVTTIGLVLAAFCFAAAGHLIWSDRAQAASERGDALVQEITELIEAAERARAADPKFLEQLRQVLEEYQGPKLVQLMHDDFSDGNFTRNPRWRQAEGEFTVDRGRGLRSVARQPVPSQTAALSALLKELNAKKAAKGRYTLVQSSTLSGKPYVPVRDNSGRFTLV